MAYRVKSTYLPEQYDFAGNILDQYDQSTYQITMYMKPEYRTDNPDNWVLQDQDVIIAQTGVTGITIPNLRIENLATGQGLVSTKITFTLEQPQSVDLPDRIISIKERFGYGEVTDTVFFMRIRFLGYTSDIEDNDSAGEPVKIGRDVYYRLMLTRMNIQVDERGGTYEFEALDTPTRTIDDIWRFPKDGYTVGETVTEHMENLCEILEEFNQEEHHEFEVDLSNLIGTDREDLIQDDQIYTPGEAESFFTRLSVAADAATSLRDRQAALRNLPSIDDDNDDGDYSEIIDKRGIPFKRGQSVYEYLVTLLSVNDEFYEMITRLANIDDPDSEIDNKIGAVRWVKMNMTHEVIGQADEDHIFIKRYTLIPTLYDNVRSDMVTDERETTLNRQDGQGRFQDMWQRGMIRKTYDYLFTGLNDQVTNLEISWDATVGLLMGRRKGTQNHEPGSAYVKATESNLNPDEETLRERNEGQQYNRPASFSQDLTGEPGPHQWAENDHDYGFSGNRGSQLRVKKTESIDEQESPVKTNSRRHTLFGHLVNQSVNDQFLLKLDMSVRGDPWYLDNGRISPSTDDRMFMRLNDNCLFLTIRSPERHDHDVDDEDNNSGYWQFGKTSRMFSGVYRVIKVVCNFDGGTYSNDLECQQILTVNVIEGSD